MCSAWRGTTFNPNLFDGQLQGLTASLNKARRKLRALRQQLERWREGKVKGKAPALDPVRKQVKAICSGQFVKLVLKAEVGAVRKGLELTYSTDQTALDRLCRIQLGKTILFTDNAGWPDEDIVCAYRSQYHIENAFRQMKNPHFLGWSPMFHMIDLSCAPPGNRAIRRCGSGGPRVKLLPGLQLFGGFLVHERTDGLVGFAERQEDLDDSANHLFELGAKFSFGFLESRFDVRGGDRGIVLFAEDDPGGRDEMIVKMWHARHGWFLSWEAFS